MTKAATRKRNPRGQGDQLRRDLLDAAADLLAEHGTSDKVGVRAVAAAVGVSPTAVYRHFDSGQELVVAAIDHAWADFSAQMAAAMTAEDPFTRFREMGDAYVEWAMRDHGRYKVLFDKNEEFKSGELPMAMQAFDMLVSVVREILVANDDDRDPFFVAVQVHSWIHGMVRLCGDHQGENWPSVQALLDGIASALDLLPKARGTSAGGPGC